MNRGTQRTADGGRTAGVSGRRSATGGRDQRLPSVVLALTLLACAAQAQYTLDWSTIDGGGGASTGDRYSVSGTIGQPDAGVSSGGQFTMQGGFWPGVMVPSTGEAPTLFIRLSGDSVSISWSPATAGFELEATADLAGAVWAAAPPGNPATLTISGAAKFYRLRRP